MMKQLLCAAALLCVFGCSSGDDALKLYLKGNDLFNKKDLKNAREYFEKAISQDATLLNAHLMLSKTFYYQKDFEKALSSIDNALNKNPDFVGALYWKARIITIRPSAKDKKQSDQAAVNCLKRVIELDGHHIPARYLLALLYEKSEQYKEALYEYQMIMQEEETILNARTNLGVLYNRLGLKDKSIEEINRALALADSLDIDSSRIKIIKREIGK